MTSKYNSRTIFISLAVLSALLGVSMILMLTSPGVAQQSSASFYQWWNPTPTPQIGACFRGAAPCIHTTETSCRTRESYTLWRPGSCQSNQHIHFAARQSRSDDCRDVQAARQSTLQSALQDIGAVQCGNQREEAWPVESARCEFRYYNWTTPPSCETICGLYYYCAAPRDFADATPAPSPNV